ncbi:MAG: hypothetical protein NVS4B8_06290 [Herpetosiphon sp.]
MSMLKWQVGWSLLLIVSLVACGKQGSATPVGQSRQSHGGPVTDHVSFVDHLRATGVTVEIAGSVQQPFLRPVGTTLRLSGGPITQPSDIQSYNYDDQEHGTGGVKAAAADAQQIGPDGNPRLMMISWLASPHFFRKERLIVIFVGDNPAVLKVLTDALGPQFAGR